MLLISRRTPIITAVTQILGNAVAVVGEFEARRALAADLLIVDWATLFPGERRQFCDLTRLSDRPYTVLIDDGCISRTQLAMIIVDALLQERDFSQLHNVIASIAKHVRLRDYERVLEDSLDHFPGLRRVIHLAFRRHTDDPVTIKYLSRSSGVPERTLRAQWRQAVPGGGAFEPSDSRHHARRDSSESP